MCMNVYMYVCMYICMDVKKFMRISRRMCTLIYVGEKVCY